MNLPLRRLNGLFMTLFALVAALLAATPASAQLGGAFGARGAPHIAASLIAETTSPKAGGTVTLAILMKPEKGWHGYWENPGDAGAGMSVDWEPAGGISASVGPFHYPVPERLVISGLMNHVYEHEYAVLVDMRLPQGLAPGTRVPVRGKAQWLACTDSICVPEAGEIATTLTIGDGTIKPEDRARFDAWRARLPRPLDRQATYEISGDRIAIAVPYPAAAPVGEPWFYALSKQRVRYAEPQRIRRKGDLLIIQTMIPEDSPTIGPIDGVLAVTPTVSLEISALPGEVPSGGEIVGNSPGEPGVVKLGSVLLALGGAFLGGLLLNIMPCVFPILSLKAISLAKAGGEQSKARREAIAYTLGILVTCLALGALMLAIRAGGTQIGWAFQLQDQRVIALLLILMVAITLNLAGAFEIAAVSLGQGKAGQGGTSGAFWTGALAAFVATPCTGPFMGAAMGAALVLPWPLALVIFAGLGLGLASPFVAIAYVPALRRLMPRPGNWMVWFRRIMAVPMGLTALGLLWLLSRQLGAGGIALGLVLALATGLALVLLGRAQLGKLRFAEGRARHLRASRRPIGTHQRRRGQRGGA
ncbi:MAG: thiol:disulfide interchange protein, partial [Sphingomonadales bacterium]|nr:thiol:disulfide interchange protein [Sphingomonadales bacterium]